MIHKSIFNPHLSTFLFLGAILVLLFSGCRGSFEKSFHRVTAIIDGNTIRVDNRVIIRLIGIQNSSRGKAYLEANVLNQPVRFVYDSGKRDPVTSYNSEVYGYIATVSRISVNAEILKRKESNLSLDFLQDSLQAFKSYAGSIISEPPPPPGGMDSSSGNQNGPCPGSDLPFVDLVKKVKQSVFVIFRQNSSGELSGLGTGFFISPDGVAVSNYHVFDGASSFIIKTSDQKQYAVSRIIFKNQQSDFILFRIEPNGESLPYLELNENQPKQGEEIFVIGNPAGLESTLTKGIVSAVRTRYSPNDLIQIDAAISPGSSGSPVFNMCGKVEGIATFRINMDGCDACNFAINADLIKNAISNN